MRALYLVIALLGLATPLLAVATDAPHDDSFVTGGCMACHRLHNAVGQSLTSQATISDQCQLCHTATAGGNPTNPLGFPWGDTEQATAGLSGSHHRWDANAVNAAVGAGIPVDPEMQKRLVGGKLECSVCHNQHAANKAFAKPGSMRTSFEIGVAKGESNVPASAGTGTLTMISADAATAVAKGYRLRIISAGNLAVSHDRGVSWFRPTTNLGASWVPDAATPVGGPYTPGTTMQLDDPAIRVQLSAGALVGDYWDFYVTFPFMRALNLAGEMCLSCHQDRAQTHADVEGPSDGTRVFSHPVGVTLNANGKSYDRTTPLDADGGVQGASGDANATNDLALGSAGLVGCTSCHAAHNADSNSQTVDKR